MVKGITKRWMINTLSVILSIIILIVVILIFSITHLFQSRVEQDLHSASNELSMVFSGFKADNPTDFTSVARDYIENFDKKEQMGVMVLNTSGRVVLTSTGFIPSEDEKMTDFDEAKQSASGYAFWNGKLLGRARNERNQNYLRREQQRYRRRCATLFQWSPLTAAPCFSALLS